MSLNRFKILLTEINDDLATSEFAKIYYILEDDYLSKRDIETCQNNSLHLFTLLKEKQLISPSNVNFLKEIASQLQRKDLLEKLEKFEDQQRTTGARSQSCSSFTTCTDTTDINSSAENKSLIDTVDSNGDISVANNKVDLVKASVQSEQINCSSVNEIDDEVTYSPNATIDHDRTNQEPCAYVIPKLDILFQDSVSVHQKIISSPIKSNECNTENVLPQDLYKSNMNIEEGQISKENESINIEGQSAKVGSLNVFSLPTELYAYQKELIEESLLGHNCIICAPTGSGKTVAVGHVAHTLWTKANEKGNRFVIIFVVCIRCLVAQQELVMKNMFGKDDKKKVGVIREKETVKGVLQTLDVIVLTGQILVNALRNKEISFSDINLLIIDECHHTNLDHPYNNLMRLYMAFKHETPKPNLPQIIGLTASLGVGEKGNAIDHYITLCANLDCLRIEHVRNSDNKKELFEHNPPPKEDQIITVASRSLQSQFFMTLHRLMDSLHQLLKVQLPEPGTQRYENEVIEQKKNMERAGHDDEATIFKMLRELNYAMLLYLDFPSYYSVEYLRQFFHEVPISEKCILSLGAKVLYDNSFDLLYKLSRDESLTDNSKIKALFLLLQDLYKENKDAKGIILTKMRINTEILVDVLEKNPDFKSIIRCKRFVGKGYGDMTDHDQEKILQKFRSNESDSLNLLVATDVAQEGLDLPKCSFVIRYNFVSNEIGSVQSKGRARAKNSRCYLIVEENSVNVQREIKNLQREHQMLKTLDEVDAIDKNKLSIDIKEKQKNLWEEYVAKLKRDDDEDHNKIPSNRITICCKCGMELCRGDELKKKGESYFICDNVDFPGKISFKNYKKEREFRYEKQKGSIICKECNKTIGLHLVFTSGHRSGVDCYSFINDAVMYKVDGNNSQCHIKKWSKVPFRVEKEAMGD